MYKGEQRTDEAKNLIAIADGYESKISKNKISNRHWLSFALQKDAIQNSWDAKIYKKSTKEWEVEFRLIDVGNNKFLMIKDFGTMGLTGTIWDTKEMLDNILESEDKEENLAYFMNSNYSAKGPESGGKRGRGKSLFLIASKDLTFYFDSLRNSDDKYIAGGIFIGNDKGAKIELESDNPIEYIKKKVGAEIHSLKSAGTRVFIKNPKQDLVEAIENGLMLNFIERTWWEIIKKKKARIKVSNGKEEKEAKLSPWYDDKQLENRKGLEKKEFKPPLSLGCKNYKLKRIKLIYDPEGKIPEDVQGIAIQRKGMTIERRATNILVREEGMNKVYGWVEMENELENAMYDLEDVEHLGFNWVPNPAKKLLDLLKIKTREFAKDVKLIENKLSKRRKIYRTMEENAAKAINKFLEKSGFSKGAIGGRTRAISSHSKTSPLRISLSEFDAHGSKRVNFGEVIQAQSVAINELDVCVSLLYKTWIVSDKGETVKMAEEEIQLHPNSKIIQGWSDLIIEEEKFPRGDYSFVSKITVLKDTGVEMKLFGRPVKVEKSLKLKRSVSFSVEKDPKSKGFLRFEGIEDKEESRYITARLESDCLVIEYNTKHSYIEKLMSDEKKEEFEKFLIEVGIIVALNQVLIEDISNKKSNIFNEFAIEFKNAGGKINPDSVLSAIMKKAGEFMALQ